MRRRNRRGDRAAVLLLTLFLMAVTVPLIAVLFDTQATHIRCIHNHIEALTAQYVAEAGVQDAMSELLADPAWRAGFTNKTFPPDLGHTYTVTLQDGEEGEILVTSTGKTAAGYTKTVVATLSGF